MKLAITLRRPPALVAFVLVVIVVALAVWFKPWGLIINETVIEAAPKSVAAVPSPLVPAPATPAATSAAPAPSGLDRAGKFVPGEHDISGTAHFISTTQGVVLRLEDLRTSNGPDVRVYLSTRANGQVGNGDLQVAPIKGNQGNQNYLLPVGADVSKYSSVVIWCERFSVGFGHAVLKA
jgi:Electron transfer DM13